MTLKPCLVEGDQSLSDAINFWFVLNPNLKSVVVNLLPPDLKCLADSLGKGAGSGKAQLYYCRHLPQGAVEFSRARPSPKEVADGWCPDPLCHKWRPAKVAEGKR